jgi:hypothetical protein
MISPQPRIGRKILPHVDLIAEREHGDYAARCRDQISQQNSTAAQLVECGLRVFAGLYGD